MQHPHTAFLFARMKLSKLSNQPKMIPHSKSKKKNFLPNSSKTLQIVLPMTSKTQQLPASYFGSPRSGPHPSLPLSTLPFRCSAARGGNRVCVKLSGCSVMMHLKVYCIGIKGFDSSTNFTKKKKPRFCKEKKSRRTSGTYKKKLRDSYTLTPFYVCGVIEGSNL